MQGRMKAIVKARSGPGAEIQTVDIPPVGPNDVLVKIQAVSLCGTDKHIYDWNAWAASRIHPPRLIGHEMSGVVVETGAEVQSVKPGDLVSSESHIVCGHCFQCRNNQKHICANLLILGVDTDGIFADYAVLPQRNCYKNDPKLRPEITCMQDAMGNAVYTALSGEIVGNTVAVIGCGAIGLGAMPVCKASGAKAVFATDVSAYRLDLAKRLGADLALNPNTSDVVKTDHGRHRRRGRGRGAGDVRLSRRPLPRASRCCARAGASPCWACPTSRMLVDLNNWIIFKGATVLGINGRELFRTWDKMAALQVSGLVDFSPIVTHRLAVRRFRQGLRADALRPVRQGDPDPVVPTGHSDDLKEYKMDHAHRFDFVDAELDGLRQQGLYRKLRILMAEQGPSTTIDGKQGDQPLLQQLPGPDHPPRAARRPPRRPSTTGAWAPAPCAPSSAP